MPEQGEPRQAQEIGARVAEARKLAGFSQAELGDLLGVSKRAVQIYENGTTIPWRHFRRLEELTGKPVSWFLHGDDDGSQADNVAIGRALAEELERHDRAMEKRLEANNGLLAEILAAVRELSAVIAPAAATIAAAASTGNLPGLGN